MLNIFGVFDGAVPGNARLQSLPVRLWFPACCAAPGSTPRRSRRCGRYGPVDGRRPPARRTISRAVAAQILRAAPPRFALAGLSYGGYIAFEIMRQAAERVAKLALLDTQARPDTPEQSGGALRLHHHGGGGPAERGGRHALSALRAQGPAAAKRRCGRPSTPWWPRPGRRPSCGRRRRSYRGRIRGRCFAGIKCPTLVLVGDADELTPPDLAREMADGIAGAKLTDRAGCGHLATLERPEAVNAALAEWLGA